MHVSDLLIHAIKRPSMYFSPVQFEVAVAFFDGFDLAQGGGALIGLHEWLVTKVGHSDNLHWSELVLALLFPKSKSPRDELKGKLQTEAVNGLFKILEEFWQVRQHPNGLRLTYLQYHEWLKRQEWYNSSSPDYVDLSPENLRQHNNQKYQVKRSV